MDIWVDCDEEYPRYAYAHKESGPKGYGGVKVSVSAQEAVWLAEAFADYQRAQEFLSSLYEGVVY